MRAELFRTETGLRVVDSVTRGKILGMLADGELSFEEIVARTGRAKSTISVHLRELVADGVLGSRADPDDGRRKYFYLDAELLGRFSDAERLEADVTGLLADYDPGDQDPTSFYRAVLRSLRVMLLRDGITIDPILYAAGAALGHRVARVYAGKTTPELLQELQGFWRRNGLGRIEIEPSALIELVVYDCFECQDLPFLGRPACAFEAGLLSSIFAGHFGADTPIRETACYAMGSGYCRFEIEPPAGPEPY